MSSAIAFAALVAFSCCCLGVVSQDERKKIDVHVYYESMCPDSMSFINRKLAPDYNHYFKEFLNVTFVPFGKASWQENPITRELEFDCQHGESECKGNREHACAIDEIERTTTRSDERQQKIMDIVNCAMEKYYDASPVLKCAEYYSYGAEFVENVKICSESKFGSHLLVGMGKKTNELESPLRFVPTIAINGIKNTAAFKSFRSEICKLIPIDEQPSVCKKVHF